MLKTFTLNRIEEEQISKTEGKMTFYLTDELGDKRSVWGYTLLDENQTAVSITTDVKREHPLIQCLFVSEINETINIEFKQYNNVFERHQMKEKTIEEIAQDMQNKPLRLGPLLKSVEVKSTETIN